VIFGHLAGPLAVRPSCGVGGGCARWTALPSRSLTLRRTRPASAVRSPRRSRCCGCWCWAECATKSIIDAVACAYARGNARRCIGCWAACGRACLVEEIGQARGNVSSGRYLQVVINVAMTREQPPSEDGQND